jgi:hypothetical protein
MNRRSVPVTAEMSSMQSLTNYAFGSHIVDWLALAVVIVLTLAVRIGTRRFIFWLTRNATQTEARGNIAHTWKRMKPGPIDRSNAALGDNKERRLQHNSK